MKLDIFYFKWLVNIYIDKYICLDIFIDKKLIILILSSWFKKIKNIYFYHIRIKSELIITIKTK